MLVAKKELEYIYEEEQEVKKKPRTTNKKKDNRPAYKLMLMFLATIGLALSLVVLYRYANITKVRFEITKLQAQKVQLEKEKDDLMAELESIKSSTKIEEDAFTKLGMVYPTEEQIVYVEVNDLAFADENNIESFDLLLQLKNMVNLVFSLFKEV